MDLLFGFYKLSDNMADVARIVTEAYPGTVSFDSLKRHLKQRTRATKPPNWDKLVYGRVIDFHRKPCFNDVKKDSKSIRADLHPEIKQLIASKNTDVFPQSEALAVLGLKRKGTNNYIYTDTGQRWNGWPASTPAAFRKTRVAVAKTTGPFQFKPGHKSKPAATTATIPGQQSNVNLRQNEIQEALYRHLVSQYGKGNVSTENATITGEIDVVVRQGAKYWFYEIKTASSARECIREALAQLLEYSFWPGAQEAERLIIVGEPSLDPESKEFLALLRKRFGIPIEYQQFDA